MSGARRQDVVESPTPPPYVSRARSARGSRAKSKLCDWGPGGAFRLPQRGPWRRPGRQRFRNL